jgi:hypothetical protein
MLNFKRKISLGYPPVQTPIFQGLPQKIKIGPGIFTLMPEISKKVCHTFVGQKLREEIDFLQTGCFRPRAIPWRLADLKSSPIKYLFGVGLVQKFSAKSFPSIKVIQLFHLDRQTHRCING